MGFLVLATGRHSRRQWGIALVQPGSLGGNRCQALGVRQAVAVVVEGVKGNELYRSTSEFVL